MFLSGPRALFGRKSGAARPAEELLASLSNATETKPKRKRTASKSRRKPATVESTD